VNRAGRAQSTMDRRWRAHRSTASGRSGALKLTSGSTKEREEHRDLGSGDTAARRGHGKLGGEGFRCEGGEERGSVRMWGAPGVIRVAFIGPGKGAGGGGWLE
jgi:hypothetical protein